MADQPKPAQGANQPKQEAKAAAPAASSQHTAVDPRKTSETKLLRYSEATCREDGIVTRDIQKGK